MRSYYNCYVDKDIIQSDYAIVVRIFANYGFYVNQDSTSYKYVIMMSIKIKKTKDLSEKNRKI